MSAYLMEAGFPALSALAGVVMLMTVTPPSR